MHNRGCAINIRHVVAACGAVVAGSLWPAAAVLADSTPGDPMTVTVTVLASPTVSPSPGPSPTVSPSPSLPPTGLAGDRIATQALVGTIAIAAGGALIWLSASWRRRQTLPR